EPVRNVSGYPYWYLVAYDRAGTRLAAVKRGSSTVTLRALPSGDVIRELTFELESSAIAMSPDGALLAIRRGGSLEVRTADGVLVMRHQDPTFSAVASHDEQREAAPELRRRPSRVTQLEEASLRFSHDGRRLARFLPGDGWRIWTLGVSHPEHLPMDQFLDDAADFATPWPTDWTLEPDVRALFVHRASGTRIALPFRSTWVSNPANPRILACAELHIELRGGESA
ncbi:MAG: hypothetical protein ABIY55_02190, partial [Kofleriaceae bacterium]